MIEGLLSQGLTTDGPQEELLEQHSLSLRSDTGGSSRYTHAHTLTQVSIVS